MITLSKVLFRFADAWFFVVLLKLNKKKTMPSELLRLDLAKAKNRGHDQIEDVDLIITHAIMCAYKLAIYHGFS